MSKTFSCIPERQRDNHARATLGRVFSDYLPTLRLEKLAAEGQTQSGSFTMSLGGKERLENLFPVCYRYPGAIIIDVDSNQITFLQEMNMEPPMTLHRLGCIEQDIDHNLPQLVGVAVHLQLAIRRLEIYLKILKEFLRTQ